MKKIHYKKFDFDLNNRFLHRYNNKKVSKLKSFWKAIDMTNYDLYGSEEFDFLIVGNDLILSLISAIKISQSGKSVLIYPDKDVILDEEVVINQQKRYGIKSKSLELFLKKHLKVSDFDFYDYLQSSNLDISILPENIELVSNGNGFYDFDSEYQYFWCNYNKRRTIPDDFVKFSALLNILYVKDAETDNKKICYNTCIKAKKIIVNSDTSENLNFSENKFINIGEAAVNLSNFEKFNEFNRMIDFSSALISDLPMGDFEENQRNSHGKIQ